MGYNISVSEFLESRDIDYGDFVAYVNAETRRLNSKLFFFQSVCELKTVEQNGKLSGLPVSVKDCICTKGIQSSAGSAILEGYKPPFDATVVSAIKNEGSQILGKTNQDEFGFGTFSVNSGYGVPKNPLDPERTCGGSSGGAGGITAAATFPHIALAESTGGSISCPASFCGVVGLTPTYGLVSRYGLIDYANSLDKIGPMGKTVDDVALMLSIIAGYDEMDSTSLPEKQKHYSTEGGIKGMVIGVPKEYFENVDEQVSKSVWNTIKKMESAGASYVEISLPSTKYALSAYYIIATAEASTNLARYCGLRYGLHSELKEGQSFNEYYAKTRSAGFGEEAKRRIILGTFARMSGYRDQYYMKALKVRTLVINEFKKAFKKCDLLAAPTMPITAPKFSDIQKLTPLENYQMDVLTVPPNLAGIPMLSVPCSSGKLPVGMHLMADYLQEERLLKAGKVVEAVK
ncbi:MAG: Asp-tRNA(Asn)/Glu-tRNA(Gln) amidotransferase subunit GatA [Candidatus Aenigmarchaeota archaeon]|nr:Asp-tRNA(Asn)/Glu-tRNA(Gln) amidotransferase subunit GatA [Candidatus Aenigmarchaeota archaeon]